MEQANLDLVNLAFTHRSYSYEVGFPGDNERLEFLGDALLGFLASRYLYEKYPEEDEGALSKRKSKMVSRSMLGRLARTLGLASFILLGKGEEITGGRRRSNLLGSALEALVGAFFLSGLSLDQISSFVYQYIIEPSEQLLSNDVFADYKSKLQEYVQKNFQSVPEYKLIKETGPDHKKLFRVEVLIQGKSHGVGYGLRKKSAENAAARIALEHLGI